MHHTVTKTQSTRHRKISVTSWLYDELTRYLANQLVLGQNVKGHKVQKGDRVVGVMDASLSDRSDPQRYMTARKQGSRIVVRLANSLIGDLAHPTR